MGLERPARKWFEKILVLVIVLVVGFLVGSNVYYQQKSGKQRTMFYQLQILRNSVNLFKVIKQRSPNDLRELASSVYKFPGEDLTRRFIENAPLNEKGEVVDPFGGKYYFDNVTGWIRSSTTGYEFW